MRSIHIVIPVIAILISTQVVFSQDITRNDIQDLFQKTSGNASYTSGWQKFFLNKRVNWKGTIFSIQYQKAFNRTEVTMKILPGTIMYDTIVYVPGDVTDKFGPKEEVSFSGTISRGIDMLGVKEVQINVGRNLGDNFGQFVFSEQGMVNVNFLQPGTNVGE